MEITKRSQFLRDSAINANRLVGLGRGDAKYGIGRELAPLERRALIYDLYFPCCFWRNR